MEDVSGWTNSVNRSYHHTDTPMDVDATIPVTIPGVQVSFGVSNGEGSTLHTPPTDDEEETQPPPAKRRRVHSDADQASLAHVSILSCLILRDGYTERLCGLTRGLQHLSSLQTYPHLLPSRSLTYWRPSVSPSESRDSLSCYVCDAYCMVVLQPCASSMPDLSKHGINSTFLPANLQSLWAPEGLFLLYLAAQGRSVLMNRPPTRESRLYYSPHASRQRNSYGIQ
jgi:hypothetical protein